MRRVYAGLAAVLLAGTFALPLPAFAADAQEAAAQPAATETAAAKKEWTPVAFDGNQDNNYQGFQGTIPEDWGSSSDVNYPAMTDNLIGPWNTEITGENRVVITNGTPYTSWLPEAERGQNEDPFSKTASNYQAKDGDVVVGTATTGSFAFKGFDIQVPVTNSAYVGKTMTAYVQFNDGTTSVKTSTIRTFGGLYANEGNIGLFYLEKPAALITFVFRASQPSTEMAAPLKSETSTVSVWTTDQTTGSITSLTELPEGEMPSNYKPEDGFVPLAKFRLKGDARNFVLKFTVDAKYAGMTFKLFYEHEDGATDVKTATIDADGTVSFAMDRLSDYVLVVDTNSNPVGVGAVTGEDEPVAKKDTSAKSPQTGVDVTAVQAMTGMAVIAAAGCAAYAVSKARSR